MKNIKIMFTCFAVFASILIISTTCIAAPIQGTVSLKSVEYLNQESVTSSDSTILDIQSDVYSKSLITKLSSDLLLIKLENAIKTTEDLDKKVSLLNSYIDVLKSKQEYSFVETFIKIRYSADVQDFNAELNEVICTPQAFEPGTKTMDLGDTGWYILVLLYLLAHFGSYLLIIWAILNGYGS